MPSWAWLTTTAALTNPAGLTTLLRPQYSTSTRSAFRRICFPVSHENRLAVAVYYRVLTTVSDRFETPDVFQMNPTLGTIRATGLQAYRCSR